MLARAVDGRAVAALLGGAAAAALPNTMLTVLMPFYVARLALPLSQVPALGVAYGVGLVVAALPMAALAGRLGPRRAFVGALVLVAVLAPAAAAPLPMYWMLLGLLGLQGAATAGLLAAVLALVRPVFGEARCGAGFGLVVLAGVLGAILLPAAAGAGMGWLGLPGLLVPVAAVVAASLWLGWPSLPAGKEAHPFDLLGAALSVLCASLLLRALYLAPFDRWWAVLLLVAGLLVLALLVWQQWRRPAPLLPLDLLAQPDLRRATVAVMLGGMAVQLGSLVLVPRLLRDWQLPPEALRTLLPAGAAAPAVAAGAAAWAMARRQGWRAAAAGAALSAVGAAALAAWPAPGMAPALLALAVLGAGRGMFDAGARTALVGGAPAARGAGAAGLLVFASGLGGLLAPFVLLLPRQWPGSPAAAAFWLAALAMLLAAWLCARPQRRA